MTQSQIKEAANKYYDQIEILEKELRKFDADQYGWSNDSEAIKIHDEIDQLEWKISELWGKRVA